MAATQAEAAGSDLCEYPLQLQEHETSFACSLSASHLAAPASEQGQLPCMRPEQGQLPCTRPERRTRGRPCAHAQPLELAHPGDRPCWPPCESAAAPSGGRPRSSRPRQGTAGAGAARGPSRSRPAREDGYFQAAMLKTFPELGYLAEKLSLKRSLTERVHCHIASLRNLGDTGVAGFNQLCQPDLHMECLNLSMAAFAGLFSKNIAQGW